MHFVLAVLAALAAGYLVAVVFYGGDVLLSSLLKKWGLQRFGFFSAVAIAVLLTAALSLLLGKEVYRFRNLNDPTIYLAVLLTIPLTLLIVSFVPGRRHKTARELALSGLDGALIELAQRPMMQPFVWWLLVRLGVPYADALAVLITGTVWCLGIITQYALEKMPFNRGLALELLASFVFSVGIGYAFQRSGFIVLTMLAHAAERVLNGMLVNRRCAAHSTK